MALTLATVRLVPAFHRVAPSIPHFVSFEMRYLAGTATFFRLVATIGVGTAIAVLRMVVIIYVAVEIGRAVKPRTSADEYSIYEPLRAIVAVGSAIVGRHVVIAVGAHRRNTNLDTDLSVSRGSSD